MKVLIICFYLLFKSKKNFDIDVVPSLNHKNFFVINLKIDYGMIKNFSNEEKIINSKSFIIQYNHFTEKLKYVVGVE